MKKRGFSAVESLIILVVFSFIVLSAFEFFGLTRGLFLKLKRSEEEMQAVIAALDKIRIDLGQAGFGLSEPIRLGIVEGVVKDTLHLYIYSLEKNCSLLENIRAGQNRILLETTEGLSPGREICFFNGHRGESRAVSSCENNAVLLSSPLEFAHEKAEAQILLLEKITLYLDERSGILRRKVNASSPQPLLDEVGRFEFDFDKQSNLVKLRLTLANDKEITYETAVFPKNTGLCLAHF